MSERKALARFHDFLHSAAIQRRRYFAPAVDQHMIEEICDAARELARFLAPFSGVLSDFPVPGDDTHEIHSLTPGVATSAG